MAFLDPSWWKKLLTKIMLDLIGNAVISTQIHKNGIPGDALVRCDLNVNTVTCFLLWILLLLVLRCYALLWNQCSNKTCDWDVFSSICFSVCQQLEWVGFLVRLPPGSRWSSISVFIAIVMTDVSSIRKGSFISGTIVIHACDLVHWKQLWSWRWLSNIDLIQE